MGELTPCDCSRRSSPPRSSIRTSLEAILLIELLEGVLARSEVFLLFALGARYCSTALTVSVVVVDVVRCDESAAGWLVAVELVLCSELDKVALNTAPEFS